MKSIVHWDRHADWREIKNYIYSVQHTTEIYVSVNEGRRKVVPIYLSGSTDGGRVVKIQDLWMVTVWRMQRTTIFKHTTSQIHQKRFVPSMVD